MISINILAQYNQYRQCNLSQQPCMKRHMNMNIPQTILFSRERHVPWNGTTNKPGLLTQTLHLMMSRVWYKTIYISLFYLFTFLIQNSMVCMRLKNINNRRFCYSEFRGKQLFLSHFICLFQCHIFLSFFQVLVSSFLCPTSGRPILINNIYRD